MLWRNLAKTRKNILAHMWMDLFLFFFKARVCHWIWTTFDGFFLGPGPTPPGFQVSGLFGVILLKTYKSTDAGQNRRSVAPPRLDLQTNLTSASSDSSQFGVLRGKSLKFQPQTFWDAVRQNPHLLSAHSRVCVTLLLSSGVKWYYTKHVDQNNQVCWRAEGIWLQLQSLQTQKPLWVKLQDLHMHRWADVELHSRIE